MRGLRPVRSSTVALLRHFATVFGLIPSSRLSVESEACDLSLRPGRTSRWHLATLASWGSGCGGCAVERFAGGQHGVHDDGEFAGDGNRGTLEAEPLSQLQAPCAQIGLCPAAGERRCCGLVEQPAQVAITPSGDMPVIVDLAGLGAPGRQSNPGANRSRALEVARFLNRGDEGGGGYDTDAGNGHEQLAGIAAPGVRQQRAAQLRSAQASTDANIIEGRFIELVPEEKIVEAVTFESEDPAFGGTMTITTRLMLMRDGTKITFVAENVPPRISAADHKTGMASTLKNLANLLE